jgi:hypothetical protein
VTDSSHMLLIWFTDHHCSRHCLLWTVENIII